MAAILEELRNDDEVLTKALEFSEIPKQQNQPFWLCSLAGSRRPLVPICQRGRREPSSLLRLVRLLTCLFISFDNEFYVVPLEMLLAIGVAPCLFVTFTSPETYTAFLQTIMPKIALGVKLHFTIHVCCYLYDVQYKVIV